MIYKLIEKSISINRDLIRELSKANKELVRCELMIIDACRRHSRDVLSDIFEKEIDVFSDFIHLFEFKLIDIPKIRIDIEPLLLRRRELKTLIGYSNRVQKTRGFSESYKWYNREDVKHRVYSVRTCYFKNIGFDLGKKVSKKINLDEALII